MGKDGRVRNSSNENYSENSSHFGFLVVPRFQFAFYFVVLYFAYPMSSSLSSSSSQMTEHRQQMENIM